MTSSATPTPPAVATSGSAPSGGPLAMAQVGSHTVLTVSSSAFVAGQSIPMPYSQYGEKFSPALAWSAAAVNTASFVVIVEDPDARPTSPFVHWLIYNLPATTVRLDEQVPAMPRLERPSGAIQGRNSRGLIGYAAPRPPPGDSPHHYHWQVFALDTMLPLLPGIERDTLMRAMKGHVLASGDLVGEFGPPAR